MKVFFKDSRDGAVGFKCKFFVWNVNDLCSPFRHLLGNVNKFCDKFNEVVRAPSVIVTRAEVHMDGSLSRSPSSTYDWDVSGSDVPDIEGSQAIMHSTPARDHNAARKRGINSCSEELPLLYKQRKETDLSLDVKIMEELKGACLGTARIPTAHLKLGVQLRELREAFIQELMGNMTEFPGHFYQPLCVIIDTLDDVSHFKESSASGYHYRVIGGCHNFTAAKRLATMYPAQDVFKTRLCTIYSNTLGEEAKLWLANRHNKIGEFRHSMTLKEKIQLCRNIFQAHVSRDDGRKWHDTVSAILCPSETKGMVKLIIKLATIEDNNYELLQEVLTLHSNGKLKGQNLSPADLIHGPSMKPYVLSPLPGLPSEAVNKMLTEVRDGTMTVGEMQKEAKVLNKLGTIQKMFLDLMTIKTWDEAVTRFPTATTRQVLEHFCQFNLRSTPSELKTFCAQLRKEENMLCEGSFKGEKGAIGHLLQCDVKSFDGDQVLQQVPAFTGAALIVLDVPEDWTWTDVKQFANTVTSMNLNESMDQFTVAIMSPVKEMAAVERAILSRTHTDVRKRETRNTFVSQLFRVFVSAPAHSERSTHTRKQKTGAKQKSAVQKVIFLLSVRFFVEFKMVASLNKRQKALAILLLLRIRRRRRRNRTVWVRSWLERRQRQGVYRNLARELRIEDPEMYRRYFRVTSKEFQEILWRVAPVIRKRDTNMRPSIPPAERLAVTLRFLATGETFCSLAFAYRIGERTISNIVTETCQAIYECLKDDFLKVPLTKEEWLRISDEFEERWNYPFCLGALDADCKLLKDCVKGVTLATRGLDYNILWKGKHNRNYLEVDMDPSFRSDGLVVDPTQEPLDLYKELVVALTTPKQWVIDACSGTGTGCIAALSEGRNVVGLEIDEEMLRHSKLRISKELKPAEEELQGPEEIEVEGMQALNDSREGSIDDTDENIAD